MLAGIDASYTDVEGIATVAGGDDDGLSGELAEGFEDEAAELLQGGDVLQGDGVVDAVGLGYYGAFKFFEGKMLGEYYAGVGCRNLTVRMVFPTLYTLHPTPKTEFMKVFSLSFVVSLLVIVGGFLVPPMGVIDGSVLTAVGLLFGFATLAQLPEAVKSMKFRKGDFSAEIETESDS